MTKEELRKEAEEYLSELMRGKSISSKMNGCEEVVKAYMAGAQFGMKKICEICEQHMLEAHPNACGCAFRRLGNEYCWEFR